MACAIIAFRPWKTDIGVRACTRGRLRWSLTSSGIISFSDGPKPDPPQRGDPTWRPNVATQLDLFSQHRHGIILIDTGKSWRHLETLAWVYGSVAFLGSGMGAHDACLAHDGLISGTITLRRLATKDWRGHLFISHPHFIVIQAEALFYRLLHLYLVGG